MARHEDLDFAHSSVHCEDCWDDQQRGRVIIEMQRANGLKERELEILESREYPESRPRYTPPAPPLQVQKLQKGGIDIEPRRT